MEKNNFKYFLAANSSEGFYSVFDKSYDIDGEWRVFIIKGGPGTGKSSFMKYFAVKSMDKGYKTVLCPCSSDPNSLDAIILPDKKIMIMDGTAPHTVDPSQPGACEKILNFGDFWDDAVFSGIEREIISTSLKNKALHKTASRYMQAVGKLMIDNYKTALACTDKQKCEQFAHRIAKKHIPFMKDQKVGKEWVRFLEGITPLGVVSYSGTVSAEAENKIIIDDEYGSASNIILEYVRQYLLKTGYEIITVKNPFLPSLLTDHIIVPELSLAFCTENSYMKFDDNVRRIHARRFISSSKLHLSRERMKFNKKAVRELLLSAAKTLSHAKSVHDDLEKYYVKAMNFEKLTEFAETFTSDILK